MEKVFEFLSKAALIWQKQASLIRYDNLVINISKFSVFCRDLPCSGFKKAQLFQFCPYFLIDANNCREKITEYFFLNIKWVFQTSDEFCK